MILKTVNLLFNDQNNYFIFLIKIILAPDMIDNKIEQSDVLLVERYDVAYTWNYINLLELIVQNS